MAAMFTQYIHHSLRLGFKFASLMDSFQMFPLRLRKRLITVYVNERFEICLILAQWYSVHSNLAEPFRSQCTHPKRMLSLHRRCKFLQRWIYLSGRNTVAWLVLYWTHTQNINFGQSFVFYRTSRWSFLHFISARRIERDPHQRRVVTSSLRELSSK